MTETDAELDYWLALWHRWQKSEKLTNGYPSRPSVIGGNREYGLQYESQLEAQDTALEKLQGKEIDRQVQQIAEPYRIALYMDAKSIASGVVCTSPYLPVDKHEREQVRLLAREMLILRLCSCGVMEVAKKSLRHA